MKLVTERRGAGRDVEIPSLLALGWEPARVPAARRRLIGKLDDAAEAREKAEAPARRPVPPGMIT